MRTVIFLFLILTAIFFIKQSLEKKDALTKKEEGKKQVSVELKVVDGMHRLFRRILANYFWMKADDYMHNGQPIIRPGKDGKLRIVGYSYRNNREIVPLLSCAIFLDPEFIEAIDLLGTHLVNHLGEVDRGISVLQKGLELNKDQPDSYQLFLSVGTICIAAKKYKKAIDNLLESEKRLFRLRITAKNKGKVHVNRQLLLGSLAFAYFELKNFQKARYYYDLSGGFDKYNRMTHYFKTREYYPFAREKEFLEKIIPLKETTEKKEKEKENIHKHLSNEHKHEEFDAGTIAELKSDQREFKVKSYNKKIRVKYLRILTTTCIFFFISLIYYWGNKKRVLA
ncbi:hypothetical protein ACFL35_11145 [Candidatus Riflebacteria bacterium]